MHKPKFGFLSPQPYMKDALEEMKSFADITVLDPKNWESDIAKSIAQCKSENIQSVGGFAQKDAFSHILINEGLGQKAPSRLAFLYCMNKYLMRTLESNPNYFDWVDPLTETNQEIADKIKEWPFMLKNTSLSLGRGVFKIDSKEKLFTILDEYRADSALQQGIADNYSHFMNGIDKADLPEIIPPFIAEHYVDMTKAIEYCYEGYIDREGNVVHYALTEEVYFHNHQALGYITPTISVGPEVAKQVGSWVDDYMGRLVELGYVNQFFNIEFWIMPDGEIAFVEINPRAAHSYHYNYELSFGNNLFGDNLKLAAGLPITDETPWSKWSNGQAEKYTLIVLMTAREIGRAGDILDYDLIEQLYNQGEIDYVRHTRQADDVLTESDMTSAGVMLIQFWISGTKEEVIAKEREIRAKAYKQSQELPEYPTSWK